MSQRTQVAVDASDDLEQLHGLPLSGLSLNIEAKRETRDNDSSSDEDESLVQSKKPRSDKKEEELVTTTLGGPEQSGSETEGEAEAEAMDEADAEADAAAAAFYYSAHPDADAEDEAEEEPPKPPDGAPSTSTLSSRTRPRTREPEKPEKERDSLWDSSGDEMEAAPAPAPPPAQPRSPPTTAARDGWGTTESIVVKKLREVEEMFNHPEYGDSDYMLTGNVPSEYKKIILNMIAEIRQIAVETTLIAISMKNDGIAVRKVLNGIVSKMAIIAKKHHKIEGGGEVVAYPMKAVDDAIMQLRKLVNTYKGVNSSKDFRFGQVQTQIQELTLEIMEYVDRKMDPRSELQPDWLVKINQKLTENCTF